MIIKYTSTEQSFYYKVTPIKGYGYNRIFKKPQVYDSKIILFQGTGEVLLLHELIAILALGSWDTNPGSGYSSCWVSWGHETGQRE